MSALFLPVPEPYRQVSEVFGGKAVLVGGAVRDLLLGQTPTDFDFATSLLPAEVERILCARKLRPYLVGKRFGTIGFKLPQPAGNLFVEVTTYRTESYTRGSRRPNVSFTSSLETDLARRDFTINACALLLSGQVVDPFGGVKDLQTKRLRCVGKAHVRFAEDPLRILRAVRFAAKYDLQPTKTILQTASRLRNHLLLVSRERWSQELDKILSLPDPTKALTLLRQTGALQVLFPPLWLQKRTLWEQTLTRVAQVSSDRLELRWAALFLTIEKSFDDFKSSEPSFQTELFRVSLALDLASRLKFSRSRADYLQEVLTNPEKYFVGE